MPTILTHTAVPIAMSLALGSRQIPTRLLIAGIAASALPDLDVLAFRLGISYANEFGHRGFSHSIAFAMLVASIALCASNFLNTSRLNSS